LSKESIAEILKRISTIKDKKDRIEALRRDHNIGMERIVDLCYNENIDFELPEGEPPYTPNKKALDLQSSLYSSMRKFGIFIKQGPYPALRPMRRQQIFTEFLETLDPDDAQLVIAIKDRKMPYPGLTRKIFEEAWPALASTWKKNG
jgi:hypothetical protein